jgi:hypothetical protein
MDSVAVAALGKIVLWSTFGITVVLGIVMQKTGFCTMGAVSDAFIMSNWTRLKQWSLAIGVAMIGVALMSYFWASLIHRNQFIPEPCAFSFSFFGKRPVWYWYGACFGLRQ